jgi:dipeptidyl aminopeptidase/acylaminoacyl peptidase
MAEGASIASDGTMVVSNEETDLDLWSLPIDADRGRVNGQAKRLTQDAAREACPSISLDGTKLAYWSELAGNNRLWFMDLRSGAKRPLTSPGKTIFRPAISMDGAQVAYRDEDQKGGPTLRLMSTSGNAHDRLAASGPMVAWDWGPDGNALLVLNHIGALLTADRVDLAADKIVPFLKRPHNVFQTHISHDGHWAIAEEASVGVLITYYDPKNPAKANWQPLGLRDADLIRWSPDDNTIYFIANIDSFRCIWAQHLDPVSKQLRGEPFAIAHFHQARRSLQVADTGEIGLAIARDKVVLAEAERTGNIWITKLEF